MPNRIIKESICYSDDIDKLTAFEETVFYRLLVRVDDYGRIDARPSFLKSMLFVTKAGITERNVSDAVAQLASLGLVKLYEVDKKPFLCLPKWHLHQRIRETKEKYPAPLREDDFDSSPQVAASCGKLPPESESNPNPNPNPKSNACENDLDIFGADMQNAVKDWFVYKAEKRDSYKPTGRKNLIAEIKKNIEKHGEASVLGVIKQSMSSNYKGITWDRLGNAPIRGKPDKLAEELSYKQRDYKDINALFETLGGNHDKKRA